jgi:hypothetical protein
LHCVLAAKILTVDFVVCTLAVKKKSGQVSTCRIGPFPCKKKPKSKKASVAVTFRLVLRGNRIGARPLHRLFRLTFDGGFSQYILIIPE